MNTSHTTSRHENLGRYNGFKGDASACISEPTAQAWIEAGKAQKLTGVKLDNFVAKHMRQFSNAIRLGVKFWDRK